MRPEDAMTKRLTELVDGRPGRLLGLIRQELEKKQCEAGYPAVLTSLQLITAHNAVVAEQAEREIRLTIWLSHGCGLSYLYGDDGEMQCNACMIDFRRLPIKEIIAARKGGSAFRCAHHRQDHGLRASLRLDTQNKPRTSNSCEPSEVGSTIRHSPVLRTSDGPDSGKPAIPLTPSQRRAVERYLVYPFVFVSCVLLIWTMWSTYVMGYLRGTLIERIVRAIIG